MDSFEAFLEDLYDDQIEEECIARKDWKRTENDVRKTGYRLGLSAGEEETLQQGFDTAFGETVKMGFAVGRLQGHISAGLSVVESMGATGEGVREAEHLKAQLTELLDACAHLQQSVLSLQHTDLPPSPLHCPHPSLPTGQTDPRDPALMPQPPSGTGEDLREVTDRLMAMDVQDLSLSPVAAFSRKLEDLQGQCQTLLDPVFSRS